MELNKLVEERAAELMMCYWEDVDKHNPSCVTPSALKLARHVLSSELRARIDELVNADTTGMDAIRRIQDLKMQIKQLEELK